MVLHHFLDVLSTSPASIGSNTIHEVKDNSRWWQYAHTSVTLWNWNTASVWFQMMQCDATGWHWICLNPRDVGRVQKAAKINQGIKLAAQHWPSPNTKVRNIKKVECVWCCSLNLVASLWHIYGT
jgi:hypothetical protein